MQQQNQKSTKKAAAPAPKALSAAEVKKIAKMVEHEIPLLGYYVYWSMTNFRITHTLFEEYLAKVGLDKAKYGKKLTEKVIVTQIVNEYTDKHRAKHKVKDEEDTLIWLIHHKDISADKENVDYRRETRITLDKKTNVLTVEGAYKEEIEKKFREYRGTYTTEQFRNSMLAFCESECEGITMRKTGGVYFVPIKYRDQLKQAEALFGELTGCEIDLTPIADLPAAKKTVFRAMTVEFANEIRALNKELDEMTTASEKVMETRIKRYQELKAKIEMYGGLVSQSVSDMTDGISALSKRIKSKLDEVE